MESFDSVVLRDVPGYYGYAISEDGMLFNKMFDVYEVPFYGNYIHFKLDADYGNVRFLDQHRAIMLAWDPPPNDGNVYVVNHIDGNKYNNRRSNLEWLTYQGNAWHAGFNELTSKSIPMQTRNILTGEIVNYPCASECSRHTGISKDAILMRINNYAYRVFPEMKQYRKGNSSELWETPSEKELAMVRIGASKPVVTRNVITDKRTSYASMSEFAILHGIKLSTASQWLATNGLVVLPGFIQVRWYDLDIPWGLVIDPILEIAKGMGVSPVVAVNEDETLTIYLRGTECAKSRNIKITTLSERLKSEGDKIYPDGCRYLRYSKLAEKVCYAGDGIVTLIELTRKAIYRTPSSGTGNGIRVRMDKGLKEVLLSGN